MAKLTVPQFCLLVDLEYGPQRLNDSYKPGRRLVELGYAESRRLGFGVVVLTITDAGREAAKRGD